MPIRECDSANCRKEALPFADFFAIPDILTRFWGPLFKQVTVGTEYSPSAPSLLYILRFTITKTELMGNDY